MYLEYEEKVSFAWVIPKLWISEPDTEPKIHLDPGSTEPVSRSVPALLLPLLALHLLFPTRSLEGTMEKFVWNMSTGRKSFDTYENMKMHEQV